MSIFDFSMKSDFLDSLKKDITELFNNDGHHE